MREKLFEAAYR